MDKVLLRRRTLILALAAWAWLGCLMATICHGQDTYGQPPAQQSSVTGSIKQGFNKVGNYFTPKPSHPSQPVDDAISLKSKSKPGPELYIAIARLYEDAGKNTEAEQYYQMALKEKPDHLSAMLGYARFQENQGRINEAVTLYQKAVQTHPKEPVAYNNLGLCFSRHGRLNEAASALGQAVQLDLRNPLYRNNLATVLVDQNRLTEAFANLREVHGEAAACYNMGYLLNKKGQTEAAEHYFTQALRVDPKMASAQKWLNYLQDKSRETAVSKQSGNAAILMGSTSYSTHFPAKVISPPAPLTQPAAASSQPQNPVIITPAAVISPRVPSTSSFAAPAYTVSNRDVDASKALPQSSDAPPLPPAINSMQRLPPVSLRQPAGMMESYPGIPNTAAPSNTAPLPPVAQ